MVFYKIYLFVNKEAWGGGRFNSNNRLWNEPKCLVNSSSLSYIYFLSACAYEVLHIIEIKFPSLLYCRKLD